MMYGAGCIMMLTMLMMAVYWCDGAVLRSLFVGSNV